MTQSNQPVFEIKYGNIKATIWLNQGEKGDYYSIDICRVYKDQRDAWQRSSSYGLSDLPKVEKAAAEAYQKIYQLRSESGEVSES